MSSSNLYWKRIISSHKEDSRKKIYLWIVFILSTFFVFSIHFYPGKKQAKLEKEMQEAALTMMEALEAVKD
ncbi:MAG: hypothetical protein ACOC57_08170, partial [Acidobacteriota bacterium]